MSEGTRRTCLSLFHSPLCTDRRDNKREIIPLITEGKLTDFVDNYPLPPSEEGTNYTDE